MFMGIGRGHGWDSIFIGRLRRHDLCWFNIEVHGSRKGLLGVDREPRRRYQCRWQRMTGKIDDTKDPPKGRDRMRVR